MTSLVSRPATPAKAARLAQQAWLVFEDEAVALFTGEPASLQWCTPLFTDWLALSWKGKRQMLNDVLAQLHGAPADSEQALAAGGWQGTVALLPPVGHQSEKGRAAVLPSSSPRWLASLRPLPSHAGGAALRLTKLAAETANLSVVESSDSATRRHLEDRERLLFTSRNVAVGEMATTLAHELNQPLGAVTNVLRGLKARMAAVAVQPSNAALLSMLEQGVQLALDQMQYASSIISRVREFTHSRQPRYEPVNLHTLLDGSLTLLDWELKRYAIELRIQLHHQNAQVQGDGVMLQQVLVNLLRNAIDAMQETPAGQRRLQISSRMDESAGNVEIAIADTGCGMGDEAAARLFMPFASTKPTGLGIGLNICRSLIELHHGRLWFSRNVEGGCTFHVALPLSRTEDEVSAPTALQEDL